jgi:hypothetical protein
MRQPQVAEAWDRPSVLAGMTVGALAGHLARAIASVEEYLAGGDPAPEGAIDAVAYYAGIAAVTDMDSPMHAGVRQRAVEAAAAGPPAVAAGVQHALARLADRLAAEPPERMVQVFGKAVLPLDEYLVTRVLELAVHVDDLAVSVALPVPELPPEATEAAITTLVRVARLRHGDTAVLRALARRERDESQAMRVL